MNFRIADTFTASLARLSGDEQKAAKTTAFDLQVDPSNPGLSFHKLDKARDKNFWSVRASHDLRLIVHRVGENLLLCYVAHHDDAYAWAERRRLETHPTTGAAQLVEVTERIEAPMQFRRLVQQQAYVLAPSARLLAARSESELLSWGVPQSWLAAVMQASEDELLAVAERLPAEAAEAILVAATGGMPQPAAPALPGTDPFAHPDAQRRFRVMEDIEALRQALESPWDRWTVFLHPAQREWVERRQSGPARVSGSAGTGKTVVALHRAVHLARSNADWRVLLVTFSEPLATALRALLRRLVGRTPQLAERIDVTTLDAYAERQFRLLFGQPKLATDDDIERRLAAAGADARATPPWLFALPFLRTEWHDLIDPWQIDSAEAYRGVQRLGRKTRLAATQRDAVWPVFATVRSSLAADGLVTRAACLDRLAAHFLGGARTAHDAVVVDEAQDVSAPQLRLLAAGWGSRSDGLFFAGDAAQRIFELPYSWRSLGVDVRGRSRTLRVNYRTSHQIRRQADRLLDGEISDVDGNVESRRDTVSVFEGPAPEVRTYPDASAEVEAAAAWLRGLAASGTAPHEVGVFVRSPAEIERATRACDAAGVPRQVLDERLDTEGGGVSIGVMRLAKGLEFRAVAVMACDDDVLPLPSRIADAADEADLALAWESERQLLYVALTRARDRLWVSGVEPGSDFLRDLA